MAAYVIFDVVVTDPEGFAAYPPLAGPTVAHYGGRFLAGPGHSATLEGDWAPRGLVVLEFPSADRARAWWDSAEYGPAKAIRQRSATSNVVLVEGAPGQRLGGVPRRRLTDEQVLALYERYRAGPVTLAQVAAEAGVSLGTLVDEFMRAGLPRKTRADYPDRPPPPPSTAPRPTGRHRAARRPTHRGATLTVGEWAVLLGTARSTLYQRLARGWPIPEVLRPSERVGRRRGSDGAA